MKFAIDLGSLDESVHLRKIFFTFQKLVEIGFGVFLHSFGCSLPLSVEATSSEYRRE